MTDTRQPELPGTRLHRDPIGYATRLETLKGTLADVEANLQTAHTAYGLVASELIGPCAPEDLTSDDRRQIYDVVVALDSYATSIGKLARAFKAEGKGLTYAMGKRYADAVADESES